MRAQGFATLLPDRLQAPIIVTFRMPADPRFAFEDFYDRLRTKGYVIYPGKLTVAPSLPDRLHRPPRRGRDAGRARGDPGDACRDGGRERQARRRGRVTNQGQIP